MELDKDVVNLTKAIRQIESGGRFDARSKDGSYGAYQFIKPTWDSTARKFGVNAEWERATPQQQNEVAYKQIKEWKDKGYNVGQIASMWNAGAGRPNAYLKGLQGVNKDGVAYDVSKYAEKVAKTYHQIKGQTIQPIQQQTQPVQPTTQQQKAELIAQGQPVSVREDRVKPTFGGQIVRDVAGLGAKLATSAVNLGQAITGREETQPFSGKYLGDVQPVGAGFDVMKGYTDPNNVKAVKDAVGTGLEAASFIPVARGAKVLGQAVREPFKQAVTQSAKALGKEGMVQGGLSSVGRSIREGDTLGQTIGQGVLGTAIGGVAGGVLGAGGTALSRGVSRVIGKVPQEYIGSQVDDNLKDIYSNITGDSNEIINRATAAKRGLERAIQSDINVVSSKSPLGGKKIKYKLDFEKAPGNELINGINNLGKRYASIARRDATNATKKGIVLDTTTVEDFIAKAIDNRDISPSAGNDLLVQLRNTGGRPVDIHDWIQNQVNLKHFKKSGDLSSTKIATVANDAAEIMRKELNTVVDRSGYAQAYGDNQELKRMIIAIAKKANKPGLFDNIGDITTDTGIDAAFSVLTGEPTFMLRTISSSLFKGIVKNIKNNAGMRSFRKAAAGASKIEPKAKLPTRGIKEGIYNYKSVGNPLSENQVKTPTITAESNTISKTGIPKVSNKIEKEASDLSTEAKKYKSVDEFVKAQGTPVYHGGNVTDLKNGLYVSGEDVAKKYSLSNKGKLNEFVLDTDTKVLPTKEFDRVYEDFGYDAQRAADYWVGKGYDIMKIPNGDILVLNAKKLKTRTQLEDIWKKANKKTGKNITSKLFPDFPNKNAGFISTGYKETDPLIKEAKKYKSVEDFIDEMRVKDWRKVFGDAEYNDFVIKFREDVKNSGKKIEDYLTDIWNNAKKK